jgi:translation initiation factor IF-3
VVPIAEAIEIADAAGLDLVEVADNADPPVCRIMDYGKFKYDQRARERQAKKHQHVVVLKEIRLRPKIESHDFEFKVDHIRKFLVQGNKVKVTVQFRGRENAHPEMGVKLLARVVEQLTDVAKVDAAPKREGRLMHTMLSPLSTAARKGSKKSKQAKTETVTEIETETE